MFTRFRDCLKRNKIFFETIVMVVLSIAGIYLSLSANRIMTKQAEIEEALSRPIINLEAVYNESDSTKIDEVLISNNGAVLGNISFQVHSFYNVIYYHNTGDFSKENEYNHLFLPLGIIHDVGTDTIFSVEQYNTLFNSRNFIKIDT